MSNRYQPDTIKRKIYGTAGNDSKIGFSEAGYLTIEQLVEELKYDKGITFQYFFANEKAIAKLSRICDLNLNK